MNTELLARIILSRERAKGWSRDSLMALADAVLYRVKGSVLDWDEGTGEDWARITLHKSVVCFLLTDAPFVVLQEAFASPDLRAAIERQGAVLLVAHDLESADYAVNLALFERAFPGKKWPADAVDSSRLSIQDLWWATV